MVHLLVTCRMIFACFIQLFQINLYSIANINASLVVHHSPRVRWACFFVSGLMSMSLNINKWGLCGIFQISISISYMYQLKIITNNNHLVYNKVATTIVSVNGSLLFSFGELLTNSKIFSWLAMGQQKKNSFYLYVCVANTPPPTFFSNYCLIDPGTSY